MQGELRHDLAALAALTAAGGASQSGMTTGISSFRTDPTGISVPFGVIEIDLGGSGSGTESWLRVDGSNTMDANFTFNAGAGASLRGILNLSSVKNTNAGGADDQITFGSNISFDPSEPDSLRNIENVNSLSNSLGDLIVDDNINVSGYIHSSSSNLILDDNVEITGYLIDTNSAVIVQDSIDVQGRTWLRENLYTYGDSYSYGSATNYSDETTHGNSINNAYMYVGDYLYVQNHMYTTIMYDRDDNNYYVDPNGSSRLNTVNANEIYAGRYYDRDNANYYADPNGYSRMQGIETTYIKGGLDNWNYVGIYENYLGFYSDGDSAQKWQGRVNADNLEIQTIDYRGNTMGNTERLSHMLPRFVTKGIFRVRDGDYIERPICPGGTAKILLTPAAQPIQIVSPMCFYATTPTGNLPWNPISYVNGNCYSSRGEYRTWATNNGAYWRTFSRGLPYGNPGYAMAQTFCQMY
jgi:hypothetical protein